MQIVINLEKEEEIEKLLQMLSKLNIGSVKINQNQTKEIDFSNTKIKSFKDIDAVEYQKKIRDEW